MESSFDFICLRWSSLDHYIYGSWSTLYFIVLFSFALCLSKELICPTFFECDGHFVHLNKCWGFLNDLPYKICICLHWYEATANFEDYSWVFLFPSRGLDWIAELIWNFMLYAVIYSRRQLPRMRKARKLILLMWLNLIWWCRYLTL